MISTIEVGSTGKQKYKQQKEKEITLALNDPIDSSLKSDKSQSVDHVGRLVGPSISQSTSQQVSQSVGQSVN